MNGTGKLGLNRGTVLKVLKQSSMAIGCLLVLVIVSPLLFGGIFFVGWLWALAGMGALELFCWLPTQSGVMACVGLLGFSGLFLVSRWLAKNCCGATSEKQSLGGWISLGLGFSFLFAYAGYLLGIVG